MILRKNDDLLGLASVDVIGSSGDKLGVMTSADALRRPRAQISRSEKEWLKTQPFMPIDEETSNHFAP